MQRRQAWDIVYDLSSFTRASFDAVKLLRSQRLVDDEVYAIIRLCLEEPLKTRVRNLLKRVAHHRQMTWPGHQQACLSLPFLSHQSFAASVGRWLRGTVLRFRPILVPFHLPSTRVRDNSPVRICCTMCPVGISSCCSMEKLIFHASVRLYNFRPSALWMDILQQVLNY